MYSLDMLALALFLFQSVIDYHTRDDSRLRVPYNLPKYFRVLFRIRNVGGLRSVPSKSRRGLLRQGGRDISRGSTVCASSHLDSNFVSDKRPIKAEGCSSINNHRERKKCVNLILLFFIEPAPKNDA
jgi:hypothetical protein